VGLQPLQLRGEITDLEGDVVHTRPSLGQELPDRRIGAERLQELDPGLADPQGCGLDTLILDPLAMLQRRAEEVGVEEDRGIEIVDGNSQVVQVQRHSCSSIA